MELVARTWSTIGGVHRRRNQEVPEEFIGNYVYLPGVSGNRVSTPDSAALSIVGDIDLRARVAVADWTALGTKPLISKGSGSPHRSYMLSVNSSGQLVLNISGDGANWNRANGVASPALGFANLAAKWLRATFVVATGAWEMFSSDDGAAWTSIASGTGTAGAIFNSASTLWLGANNSGSNLTGKVYQAEIRNGIGGAIAGAFDPSGLVSPSVQTPNSIVAGTGETWTIDGAAWRWNEVL